jgi:hypothetical protein
MKKYTGTGKPPRARKPKRRGPPPWLAVLKDLPHLDHLPRVNMLQTQAYLSVSLPTILAAIKRGDLESFVADGKRWVTPASIKRYGTKKPEKFQPMHEMPSSPKTKAA